MIENISSQLFANVPQDTLYHYTSYSGMLGIIKSRTLRASDIRYMNDSAELKHTLELLSSQITERIIAGTDHPKLLNQLLEWLSHRIVNGPMLFGASFRANGNLLSQWRGYSMHGKGVSLGFNPEHIKACANEQNFQVGKCIYDAQQQRTLISDLIDTMEETSLKIGENTNNEQRSSTESYYDVFEQMESDLLRIAAILKHPSFEEEQEWRLISSVIPLEKFDQYTKHIHFREGTSMLVPYFNFQLHQSGKQQLGLDQVFLGPTVNSELSMNSLKLFLQKQGCMPQSGISYCQIPYRQK